MNYVYLERAKVHIEETYSLIETKGNWEYFWNGLDSFKDPLLIPEVRVGKAKTPRSIVNINLIFSYTKNTKTFPKGLTKFQIEPILYDSVLDLFKFYNNITFFKRGIGIPTRLFSKNLLVWKKEWRLLEASIHKELVEEKEGITHGI
jgi:hypothetical protein